MFSNRADERLEDIETKGEALGTDLDISVGYEGFRQCLFKLKNRR